MDRQQIERLFDLSGRVALNTGGAGRCPRTAVFPAHVLH